MAIVIDQMDVQPAATAPAGARPAVPASGRADSGAAAGPASELERALQVEHALRSHHARQLRLRAY